MNDADHIANDHPFQCAGCSSCYIESRFAARCCEQSATDLRDGSVQVFSAETEAAAVVADDAAWEIERARYCFDCSCGESYLSVSAAINCRKCRVYTNEGFCTEVYDTRTEQAVWRSATLALPNDEDVEVDTIIKVGGPKGGLTFQMDLSGLKGIY